MAFSKANKKGEWTYTHDIICSLNNKEQRKRNRFPSIAQGVTNARTSVSTRENDEQWTRKCLQSSKCGGQNGKMMARLSYWV